MTVSTSETVHVPLFPEDRPQDLDPLSVFYQTIFEVDRDDVGSSSSYDRDKDQSFSCGSSILEDLLEILCRFGCHALSLPVMVIC